MIEMTFPEFLTRKFLEWQNNIGERKTIEDFAIYIGVSRPLLTMWMNGDRTPGTENRKHLAEIFGVEVYDVLGKPRPNLFLYRINKVFDNIPPEKQQQLAENAEQYEIENEQNRLSKVPKRRKISSHP